MDNEHSIFKTCNSACGSQRLLQCIASNPEVPESVLLLLINYSTVDIVERIAENPNISPRIMRMLAAHDNARIRSAVADNTNLLPDITWRLAMDQDVDVRYTVAENPSTPGPVLKMLAEDDNPYISFRAQQTLSRLDGSVTSVTVSINVERTKRTNKAV